MKQSGHLLAGVATSFHVQRTKLANQPLLDIRHAAQTYVANLVMAESEA